MEALFIFLFFVCLISNILSYRRCKEIRYDINSIENSVRECNYHYRKIIDNLTELEDSLNKIYEHTSSLPSQLPQTPIRPNNWDSMRKAFQGPVRMDHE